MKKFKSIITLLVSMILVSAFTTALIADAATRRVLYATINPQEQDYYCGVASLQALLRNENSHNSSKLKSDARGSKSQKDVVGLIKKYGGGYNVDSTHETAWFTGNDSSQASNRGYNPLCATLQRMTDYDWQILGRYTNRDLQFNATNVRYKIMNSIDHNHCVLANGQSCYKVKDNNGYVKIISYNIKIKLGFAGNTERIYPNTTGHWFVVDGYEDNGYTLLIRDPAWHGVGCGSWNDSSNIFRISLSEFMRYIDGSHGIIYWNKESK
ncbi:MAG: C39 family peptidase [Ruminococcus sp.]|uniref:C39 family peptidase n=1 Tax=Ruminococcus sp. TaxID=41978 RepID=UPI0025DD0D3A|nr:C39 family peptidase [Ruminococcus sp.]MCR5601313.1 C39 family peptidase [Ruminococcus sp.]